MAARVLFGLSETDVLTSYLDNTYSTQKIRRSLVKPGNIYYVADFENSVVGFLKLKPSCPHRLSTFQNQLQLQKIYILPDYADSGIGSKLMQFGEKSIAALAPVFVWLQVYEGNERAESFYRRFGFDSIGKDEHVFGPVKVKFTVMSKMY